MSSRLKIFFDGGCRPSPGMPNAGQMEIAVVAAGRPMIVPDAGHGTSEDAEWLALLQALTIAQGLGRDFVLLGDSRSVIAQATGVAKPRGTGIAHHAAFRTLASTPPHLRWIKRQQNLAGIVLAKLHPR